MNKLFGFSSLALLVGASCSTPDAAGSPESKMQWLTPNGVPAVVEQDWQGVWDLQEFSSPTRIAFGEEQEFKLPCETTRVGVAEMGENARVSSKFSNAKLRFRGRSDAYSLSAGAFAQEVDGVCSSLISQNLPHS